MHFKLFSKGNEARQMKWATLQPDEGDSLSIYLHGMSALNARISINRHFDDSVLEKFDLKELKDMGRYYTATIVEADGKLIVKVLIDKQTGEIQRVLKRSQYFE